MKKTQTVARILQMFRVWFGGFFQTSSWNSVLLKYKFIKESLSES